MAKISVDGVEFDAKEGENLLQAVLSAQLELPYFCWHPSLGSVGACRQCAVIQYADEEDTQGRLIMACMTPVADGMRVSLEAAHARDFRASVIEWLMENHPHDCPVCEEGGECHLQDMTVMSGHTARRYRGNKRTFENQYLGPFLNHEMNRCITCYRCVRYYQDYAGGTDLQAFGSRARMYFGREEAGVLENPFSGNLVEVCPTGVFTDKPFSKTYTRKWDLQSAPSVCAGCAVGCNTIPSERYGRLKRVHNRYNGSVNGYFLCDRGRYGFGYVNDDARIHKVGVRAADGVFDVISAEEGEEKLGDIVRDGAIGIGSPRASLESNLALKVLVGEENFCTGLSSAEDALMRLILDVYECGGARIPTLAQVEEADAVLILGEDVLNTAPRVALAVRQSVRNESLEMAEQAGIPLWQEAGVRSHGRESASPLLVASLLPTELDELATHTCNGAPESLAAAGFAIAHRLNSAYAAGEELDGPTQSFVDDAAAVLSRAKRPLVISGTSLRNDGLIKAAANIAWALKAQGCDAGLLLTAAEANSCGVGMLGGGVDLDTALRAAAAGQALVVLENDVTRRADPDLVASAFSGSTAVAVLDSLENATTESASLVLPAATFAESTGTFVNYEGRAQRFFEVFAATGETAPAWRWLSKAGARAGRNDMHWQHVDQVVEAVASHPRLVGVADAAPNGGHRNAAGNRVPRAPHRYSGRTAMNAGVNIHEPKTQVDEETPLSYSMEGAMGDQPAALTSYVWSPGWNSNQSVFKFQQEVGGAMAGGDPGVRMLDAEPAQVDFAQRYRPLQTPIGPEGDGRFKLLPTHSIFGSEELSGRSQPIAERGPQAFIVLGAAEAARLQVAEGMGVRCPELDATFAVRVEESLAEGLAVVAMGLGGLGDEVPSERVTLEPDPEFVPPTTLIARG